jgi:hypothetical protein
MPNHWRGGKIGKREMTDEIKIAVISCMLILATIIFVVIAPYFEAKAFNRVSEKKVTYWDAVFLDLRVEAK